MISPIVMFLNSGGLFASGERRRPTIVGPGDPGGPNAPLCAIWNGGRGRCVAKEATL